MNEDLYPVATENIEEMNTNSILSGNNTFEYTVMPGDSLWKISQTYGTTMEDIKKTSGITSDYLSIGQKLKITMAGKTEVNYPNANKEIKYTVKDGDSLWEVANEHDMTVNQLMQKNNLTSTLLHTGQELYI